LSTRWIQSSNPRRISTVRGVFFLPLQVRTFLLILKFDNLYYHRIKWLEANGSRDLHANGSGDSWSPLVFGCGHEERRLWDESPGTRGSVSVSYQTQALQFLNKPEDALINLPSTLLVHSVGQGMEDLPAQLHLVCSFRRCDQDPNQPEALHTPVGPARLCMEHTTLLEAKQLLSALTDQTSDRRRGYR